MTAPRAFIIAPLAFALAACSPNGSAGRSATTIAPIISNLPGQPGLVALDLLPAVDLELPRDGKGGFRPAHVLVDAYWSDGSLRDLTTGVALATLDPAVARVTSAGLVEGVGPGVTTLEVAARTPDGRLHVVRREVRVGAPIAPGAGPARLELHPGPRRLRLVDPAASLEQRQGLVAVLVRTDGSREDVSDQVELELLDPLTRAPTTLARLEAGPALRGLEPGEVDVRAVLPRQFLSAATRLGLGASVAPVGSPTAWSGEPLASSTNPLDRAALAALRDAGVEPGALCTDAELLRRATTDLLGRPPTLVELEAFEADRAPDRRARAIRRLVASPELAPHWARSLLVPSLVPYEGAPRQDELVALFVADLDRGRTLGELVTRLVAGPPTDAPREIFDAWWQGDGRRQRAAQLLDAFAGMTVRCAMCHDHPLAQPWSRVRGQGLYSFLAEQDGDQYAGNSGPIEPRWDLDGGTPIPGRFPVSPVVPQQPLPNLEDRRDHFAELLVGSRAFQRGLSHRVWANLSTPLLDPSRFLETRPQELVQPAVLEALADAFRDARGSLPAFLEVVLGSRLYQLSSDGGTTRFDPLLARRTVSRHLGVVIQRGAHDAVGLGRPAGPLAVDPFAEALLGGRPGRPTGLGPLLTLTNYTEPLQGRLGLPNTDLARLAAQVQAGAVPMTDAIRALFRRALTRDPTPAELTEAVAATAGAPAREALEDVLAGLLASGGATLRY